MADAHALLAGVSDRMDEHAYDEVSTILENALERQLGSEQCCQDCCDGGACETCPGCAAGWCPNGHDFTDEVWASLSDEDREQWWSVARDHNVGIAAALTRAETAEAEVARLRAELKRIRTDPPYLRLNEKQRATLDRMEAEAKERWNLHAGQTMHYAFDEQYRPDHDPTVRVTWGDGERIAEATINRHGHGGYWVADVDLLHNDHDDECGCKHCVAYRDQDDEEAPRG